MADPSAHGDALWRAVTYLAVAQLHLRSNPLAAERDGAFEVKPRPSGHWGTVPGTAWALAHVALAAARLADVEVVPLLGAGHAGIVQRGLAWLTDDVAKVDPRLSRDTAGLTALVASFPDADDLGSEVHPALPAGSYMGGWLGGALAFAQGLALDAPDRVVVPIVGDGECETPSTAASWLAQRVIPGARVLPIVHLNGRRMGGRSLLGAMSDEEIGTYARGHGWEPVVVHVDVGSPLEHSAFHRSLVDGIEATRSGQRRVVLLRCVKGWSGPVGAHKTPLTDVQNDARQRAALRRWISSYRPDELFDDTAHPVGALALALDRIRVCDVTPAVPSSPAPMAAPHGRGFAAEVSAVLRSHAGAGDFKVFSPDELDSNRLGDLAGEPWAHELLAEEVLLGWLAGWTASGRRGVLISYEAFAPLLLTGLIGHLKQRRLAKSALPSINILLTSYGWHNVYTHGDPSLATALLGTGDPAVHVFTPADANRAAYALDDALRSSGQVNIVVAGKHATRAHPGETIDHERRHGLAIWSHLSDSGEPDLTLVCAGDLAAAIVGDAAQCIRDRHGCRVRVVNVHDLAALADPTFDALAGNNASVLIATLGQPAAIWGLLRGRTRSTDVVGWVEPPRPMSQDRLAAHAGLDISGITRAATSLLCREEQR